MNELQMMNKDRMYMMIFMVISSSVLIKLIGWLKTYAALKVIEIIVN